MHWLDSYTFRKLRPQSFTAFGKAIVFCFFALSPVWLLSKYLYPYCTTAFPVKTLQKRFELPRQLSRIQTQEGALTIDTCFHGLDIQYERFNLIRKKSPLSMLLSFWKKISTNFKYQCNDCHNSNHLFQFASLKCCAFIVYMLWYIDE